MRRKREEKDKVEEKTIRKENEICDEKRKTERRKYEQEGKEIRRKRKRNDK